MLFHSYPMMKEIFHNKIARLTNLDKIFVIYILYFSIAIILLRIFKYILEMNELIDLSNRNYCTSSNFLKYFQSIFNVIHKNLPNESVRSIE